MAKKARHPNQNQGAGSVPGMSYAQAYNRRTTPSSRKRLMARYGRAKPPQHAAAGQQPVRPATPHKPKPKPHPLVDQANALAQLRYGDAQQSLNQEGRAIEPWYADYMNQVTATQNQMQGYSAGIQQAAQARAQEAGQTAPGVDPNSQAGHDAALAAAARKAIGDLAVTTLQGVTGAQNNYFAGRKAVAATSQLGEQKDLARRKTALKKERGAYVTSTLQDLRDKRTQAQTEAAALGIKASTESNKLNKFGYTTSEWNSFPAAKKNRIRNKNTATAGPHPDLGAVNKYGYSEKRWRNMPQAKRTRIIDDWETKHNDPQAKGNGKKNPFTYAARQKTKAGIREDIAAVNSQLRNPHYKPEKFWRRAYQGLVEEKGRDPVLARAVIQIMRHGHVSPQLAKKLREAYGIQSPPSGKRVKLPPAPGSIPGVGGIIQIGIDNTP